MGDGRRAFVNFDVADPLVAWTVYRGEMVAAGHVDDSALSFWLMRTLRNEAAIAHRSARFRDELALEVRRATDHPIAVSRLTGFYAFDDEISARAAMREWRGSFRQDNLATVTIAPDSRTSRHDAQWISHHMGSGELAWMDSYLSGEAQGANPIWELIVDGRARVAESTVQATARKVVEQTWPPSMPLLEISRIGAELGSDLGLIAATILGPQDKRRVGFMLNFVDATNPAFLNRLSSYTRSREDLGFAPDFAIVPPDLRDQEFELT